MSNIEVSSDVDTMLKSADNAAILSNIGAASMDTVGPLATEVSTNTADIATNTADIASNDATLVSHLNNILINASNITTNQNAIALNTAKVGITTAQANAITSNTNEVQVNTANIAQIATDTNTNTSDIATNTSDIATNTSDIATNASDIATNTQGVADNAQAINVKADKSNSTLTGTTTVTKLVTGEIQCPTSGPLPSQASPINYDATEHRFRDYDESPSNLMVIKKINYVSGARVGINIPADQNPKVALHIAYGGSSNGLAREALRVSGGAFFNEWVRIGHYTDNERDNNIANPTNGTIIYNIDHHEFQGYIGGGQGSDSRWQAFTMQNVAT